MSDSVSMTFDPLAVIIFLSSSYLTLARGGYIIQIKPSAIGMEVVPMLNWPNTSAMLGKT